MPACVFSFLKGTDVILGFDYAQPVEWTFSDVSLELYVLLLIIH